MFNVMQTAKAYLLLALKNIFGLPLNTYYLLTGQLRRTPSLLFVIAVGWAAIALVAYTILQESALDQSVSDARVFWFLFFLVFPFLGLLANIKVEEDKLFIS